MALMADAAEINPTDRVLEVGTGSGYGAAVLGQLADVVWSVERIESLADDARVRLLELGYDNVHVLSGDGSTGLLEEAPFDAIIVTAAAASIPRSLMDQLVDGGRLVIPVGAVAGTQQLTRVRRRGRDFIHEDLVPVRFVPLIED
ncbi:MAG: protein-L-isoaspartate O-methyltransferase [Acidimicrobiales bacterium]